MPSLIRHLVPLLVFMAAPLAFAQDSVQTVTDTAAGSGPASADQLLTIQRNINWLSQQLESRRKDLATAAKDEAADIAEDVADLESRLQKARLGFIAAAAEVELPAPDNTKNRPKKRDLLQEAQQFIEPLFDAIRRVSEKPRRIEGYRTRVFDLRTQLAQVDRASANLDHAIQAKTYPAFEKQLEDSRAMLAHNRDDLQIQVDAFERKLSQEMADHRTVAQVLSEEVQAFFANKGKDLAIAALVYGLVLWALLYCKRYVLLVRPLRRRAHLKKALDAIYGAAAALVASIAVLFTLHFLNDWFLVTVLTLFLLGAFWAFKAFMPMFLNELKLVLSLGPVREGERVVWGGVPWLVKTLGFRSELVNEDLQGGQITLPASSMWSLVSRSVVAGEPWFPTRVGDHVALDDGTYGMVETQTPETVIVNLGSTRKSYATAAFLARNPQNFSRGFEITAEFFARGPVSRPFEELRGLLKAAIGRRLAPELKGLEVMVTAPSPASTRVWARADCPGKLAAHRDNLKRELQRAAAESWREHEGKSQPA